MTGQNCHCPQRGFTLLEVMIALAIVAGVVFTVLGTVNHHLAITARDREENAALMLARNKLADLARDKELPERQHGSFKPDWPEYDWDLVTTPTEIAALRKLTLAVTWDNKQRSLTLVQYQVQ